MAVVEPGDLVAHTLDLVNGAVSYTHLDVYKRQLLTWSHISVKTVLLAVYPIVMLFIFSLGIGLILSTDVYKRQGGGGAGIDDQSFDGHCERLLFTDVYKRQRQPSARSRPN